MNKAEKNNAIDELVVNLKEHQYVYVTDSSNLSANANNDLRKLLHKNGVRMQVIKNTFVHQALERGGIEWGELKDTLKGTTALLFASNPKAPAIAIKEYRKNSDRPLLKGAYIDSDIFIGDDQLGTLIDLKTREELVGEIIGLLKSPAVNVISGLKSSGNTIAGLLKTLAEREN
ncbi:MAG: 50S ribosomal protein L10 [Bacteroidia bacterium]|nr:50S ribosomal protein L10 [Bacteroidia bacterium]